MPADLNDDPRPMSIGMTGRRRDSPLPPLGAILRPEADQANGTAADMSFRGYAADELEHQFNPRVTVPDHADYLARRGVAAAQARERLRAVYDVAYGPGPLERLDIFPGPRPAAPVQVYFHGGYWRAADKRAFSHLAEPLVAAGAAMVLVNYDLCPAVTVDQIIAESRRAIAWIYRNIAAQGGDPSRIYISGSSAGGHLAAMALAHDWAAVGLPADLIKGAAVITGVHDLEPVLHISVNREVRLDAAGARRNSPLNNPPRRPTPVIVAVGALESREWIKQSKDYAAVCGDAGCAVDYLEIPAANHFSVTETLGELDSPLSGAIRGQMGLDAGD